MTLLTHIYFKYKVSSWKCNKYFHLLLATCIYLISAIYNTGFYHYDEHYQIIEFAELKLGNTSPDDLAWEYEAQIRPAIQPALAIVFFTVIRFFGLSDPHLSMMVLRIITGICALFSISYFLSKTKNLLEKKYHTLYICITLYLWFIPFVNVRFSSECYSGLLFLLGVAVLYSKNNYKYLVIGFLLGLSFIFRFQSAFMSLGYIGWLIFIKRISLKKLSSIVLSGFFAVLIGVLIDSLYYQQFTLTFLNYFEANIINDIASDFGISPWYYYIIESIHVVTLPIGIILWGSLIIQIFLNKKGLLVWILVPFLLVHFIIPHKELRFLFPIVNFIPLSIMLSLSRISLLSIGNNKYFKPIIIFIGSAIIILNVVALTSVIFSPADDEGRTNIAQAIDYNYSNKNVRLLRFECINPYKPISIPANFYTNYKVKVLQISMPFPKLIEKGKVNLIVLRGNNEKMIRYLNSNYVLKEVTSGIPNWVIPILKIAGFENRTLVLIELLNAK